jgi:hypothetical protein
VEPRSHLRIVCAIAQFRRYFVKFPALDPLLRASASPFKRDRVFVVTVQETPRSSARAGITLAEGAFALAVVKREADTNPAMEYCATHIAGLDIAPELKSSELFARQLAALSMA